MKSDGQQIKGTTHDAWAVGTGCDGAWAPPGVEAKSRFLTDDARGRSLESGERWRAGVTNEKRAQLVSKFERPTGTASRSEGSDRARHKNVCGMW